MDRIPMPPIKKDTAQRSETKLTLPPLRATAQPEISKKQDTTTDKDDSPVVLPRLVEAKSGVILGSQPLFTSEHDDKVGSVYFEKGRLRLIHPYGPVKEVYRSYCICLTNPNQKVRNRELETMIKWLKQYLDRRILIPLDDFKEKFSSSISMVEVDKHAVTASMQGNLFELILDSMGRIKGYHPSRGDVRPLKKTLTQQQLDCLEFAVVYSNQLAKWIIDRLNSKGQIQGTYKDIENVLRIELETKRVNRAKMLMVLRTFVPLLESYFTQNNINRVINNVMTELKLNDQVINFLSDINAYLDSKRKQTIGTHTLHQPAVISFSIERELLSKYSRSSTYSQALKKLFTSLPPNIGTFASITVIEFNLRNNPNFKERLCGYIGNQFLRGSRALDGTGLDVDDDN